MPAQNSPAGRGRSRRAPAVLLFLVPFLLHFSLAAPASADADADADAAPIARSDLSLYLQLGLAIQPSELRLLRGTTYGLDLEVRFANHATLTGGCEQVQTESGTMDLRLRSWRTTCGVTLGVGYRTPVFFVGAAAGIDALLSTHVLSFVANTTRSWTFRPLARFEVSALYVSGRYRVGLRVRARVALEYVDARFALSIGYAFAAL